MVGQDAGTFWRRLGGQDPHRLLEGSQAGRLVAGPPALAPQPHQQQRHPYRVLGRVEQVEGGGQQPQRTLALAGSCGRIGGPGRQLDPVQPGRPARVGHLLPQLKGSLVVALGLGEGVGPVAGHAGLDPS